jgi:glutathione S-transferase
MKLFYSRGACSLACRIIIHELNLPCEFVSVDLSSKTTEDGTNFLNINPKGSVPVLITDDNQTLTENAVILQYLAETAKNDSLIPSRQHFNHYRVLEWVNFVSTELHKSFGPLFNPNYPQDVKDNIVIPHIKRKLDYVNKQLEITRFLALDQFTLADAYLFVVLRWASFFKMDLNEWPQLPQYFSALLDRKAIQESMSEEKLKTLTT